MKRLSFFLLSLLLLAGCGTHRHDMELTNSQQTLPTTAKYTAVNTTDRSGYVFPKDEEGVDIPTAMTSALNESLKEYELFSDNTTDSYSINVTVTDYEPGNAFGRWLFPGVGSTELKAESKVTAPDGSVIGTIKTKNTIDAGGAYTIGAWKTIFKDAAEEIVKEIRETMGLIKEKEKTASK